jgi:hypothetical protein
MVDEAPSDQELEAIKAHIGEILGRIEADQFEGGFMEHLASDDLLGLVLRAHLWVERELEAIITALLPFPERLRRRWSFGHRLELVAALGILDEKDVPGYEDLDDLRNRLAHRFNYQLSEQDQEALLRKMRPDYGLMVSKGAQEKGHTFPRPLRAALETLIFPLQWKRHELVYKAERRGEG